MLLQVKSDCIVDVLHPIWQVEATYAASRNSHLSSRNHSGTGLVPNVNADAHDSVERYAISAEQLTDCRSQQR